MDDDRLAALVREMAKIFLDDASWNYDALDPRLQALLPGGDFAALAALGNGRTRVVRDRGYL